MAFGNTFDLKAIFTADISNFESGMKRAAQAIKDVKDSTSHFKEVGDVFSSVGGTLTKGLTVPIVGAGIASVKAFADMETAMKGVQKTTDMTDDEIAQMKETLKDMSEEMPVAATELAGIAEAAGQLGISKEHLVSFTETMAMLATATNMSSEEAATSLAQFANITQMSEKDFGRLGSTIVELGNNMATTEADIVSMGQRLAGTGSMVGLTEHQIMGLSAAMASVGIEAEAGGTAMSMSLKKIDQAVRESGEELEGFAAIAGTTAEEFAQQWQEEPQVAITNFIKGLGEMIANGEDANGALEALGITGIRETDTLLRLAGAGDLVGEAFDMASQAWEENTALSEEATTAWESMKSQAKILWNQIVNLAESFGERLAPAIEAVIEKAQDVVRWFDNLNDGAKDVVIVIGILLAVIGPLMIFLGKILTILPLLTKGFAIVSGALAGLAGPIAIAIAAVAAFIGLIIYLWNTSEQFRDAVVVIWEMIKSVIQTVVDEVVSFVMEIWGVFVQWWNENNEFIRETAEFAWEGIQKIIEFAVTYIVPIIQTAWETVKSVTSTVWEGIKTIVKSALEIVLDIIKLVMSVIQGDWETVWEAIKDIAKSVWDAIKAIVETYFKVTQEIISTILGAIKSKWDEIWGAIKAKVSEIWEQIKSTISNAINDVKEKVSTGLNNIKDKFTEILTNIVSGVRNKFNEVVSAVSEGMKKALNKVTGFASDFIQAGKNIVSNIAEGIRGAVDVVKDAVGGVLQAARNLLPFSPPKDKSSPLVDIHKNGITEQIAKGILAGKQDIDRAMRSVLDPNVMMNRTLEARIDHRLNPIESAPQPMNVSLTMGEATYRGFTDDINRASGQVIEIKELM